jgi:RNA polymerase sigma factor (sigma-70 family)
MRNVGFNDQLRRVKERDPKATQELLAAIGPRLRQLALTYGGMNCAAESVSDLVQEVTVRIWQKLDQFQGTADDAQCEAMFYQWMDQVVRRLALDMQRERGAQRRTPAEGILRLGPKGSSAGDVPNAGIDPPDRQRSPSSLVQANERDRVIRAALESLTDETARRILSLRFIDGLSLRQISEQLGLSYDKVRELYNRSLRQLETKLEGLQ